MLQRAVQYVAVIHTVELNLYELKGRQIHITEYISYK